MGVIWKNKAALKSKTRYHPTFYHHWFKTLKSTCFHTQLSTQYMGKYICTRPAAFKLLETG